ncbi:MAG: class I SAM-dependent methyltransferase [Oscillospiraceae bacterium]|nr:class I SAM-dependent methyltransferase [Oscillospiraceae bacterium]
MANNWKSIWEKRRLNEDAFNADDINKLFSELKRADGFDVGGGELSEDALLRQYEDIKQRLTKGAPGQMKSVYEFGCGSGANLLLLERDGFTCGGIDYSNALVDIAVKVLKTKDLTCGEAVDAPIEPKYDCILANSVISYFPDTDYTVKVLEKMFKKTNYSIGLIDVHNIEKKDDFIAFRRKNIENYDEKYADLNKLFYSKDLFADFAEKNGLKIEFSESAVENYWNNEFVFNCFMYKR